MSEYAGFIQSPDAPFKNSNDYIDIGRFQAPFVDPDDDEGLRRRHTTINLSVVPGRYNMLDCVAGLWSGNADEPGPSERRAIGFLGVWP
ncbi:hypothetical protein SAMN05216525_118131 [Bradyrhizobium sp. Gha]|nr:hypothetical protein SAMN05216525_118131 [Bradyrhizobium sp. Gha]